MSDIERILDRLLDTTLIVTGALSLIVAVVLAIVGYRDLRRKGFLKNGKAK